MITRVTDIEAPDTAIAATAAETLAWRQGDSAPGAPPAATAAAVEDTLPENRYLNRELSWLDFNARVLALAEDTSLPLLERAKFLAIFASNLDEFFQVRVSGLKDQLAAGIRPTSPDGMDQLEQLRAIRARVEELVTVQAAVF